MNKIIYIITPIAIAGIIGIPLIKKINNEYNDTIYLMNEKLIVESAENCYYTRKCDSKVITLKDLKSKGYLKDTLVDPKTKLSYNEESYVQISKTSTFYLK